MLAGSLVLAHRDGFSRREPCANIRPHSCGNPWLRQPASSLAARC
jgi:hypothetical protein